MVIKFSSARIPTFTTSSAAEGGPVAKTRTNRVGWAPTRWRPVDRDAGCASLIGRWMQRLERSVVTTILGASALPAVLGAPLEASAAPTDPTCIDGGLCASKAHHTAQGIVLEGMQEALLRMISTLPSSADRGPGLKSDDVTLDKMAKAVSQLEKTQVSDPQFIADLQAVMDAISVAKPGEFAKSAERAINRLPRNPHLDAPRAALARLISPGPNALPSQVRNVLRAYEGASQNIRRVTGRLPNVSFVMPTPLQIASPNGAITIAGGAKFEHRNGGTSIAATGVQSTIGGVVVDTQGATIDLGDGKDELQFEKASVMNGARGASLSGVHAEVDHGDNWAKITADHAQLDFDGSALELTNASLEITEGKVSAATDSLDATLAKGTNITAEKMNVEIEDDAEGGRSVEINADKAKLDGRDVDVSVRGAKLLAKRKATGETTIVMKTRSLDLEAANTSITSKGRTTARLEYDKDGNVTRAVAIADKLAVVDPSGNALTTRKTSVALDFHKNGTIGQISAKTDKTQAQLKAGSLLSIRKAKANATLGSQGDLQELYAEASKVKFEMGDNKMFSTKNIELDARYEDGKLASINVSSEKLRLKTVTAAGDEVDARLKTASIEGVVLADGSQKITASGEGGKVVMGDHTVKLDEVGALTLETDPAGRVQKLDAEFPTPITFTDDKGKLKIGVEGAKAAFDGEAGVLSAVFDELGVKLKGGKFRGLVKRGEVSASDDRIRIALDSAELTSKLGKYLRADVEGVEIVVDKNAAGQLKRANVTLDKLDAYFGVSVVAKTDGIPIRLTLERDLEGVIQQRLSLHVPTGGEIEVRKGLNTIVVNEEQTLRLERDHAGAYRVDAQNLDVSAELASGTKVKVDGQRARVRFNPQNQALIIDEIRGTDIKVEKGDLKADINIEAIQDLLVKVSGVRPDATGIAIQLTPTGENSRIAAEVTADVSGVPISVSLQDLRQLDFVAEMSTTDLHVLAADPSGEGHIDTRFGPLRMSGSAIEVMARYQRYDPNLMLSTIGRLASRDGLQLMRGLTIEPDGAVRLKTPNRGPQAELTVLLPRSPDAPPTYLVDLSKYEVSGGATLALGWRTPERVGRVSDTELKAFVGAVPGAYIDWNQMQGRASLLGMPLDEDSRIPATVVAGMDIAHETSARSAVAPGGRGRAKVEATAGVYANPVSALPNWLPIEEKTEFGAFAGVRYTHDQLEVGLDAVVDVDENKRASLGGLNFTLGARF